MIKKNLIKIGLQEKKGVETPKKKKEKREGGEIKTQFCIKEKRCAKKQRNAFECDENISAKKSFE